MDGKAYALGFSDQETEYNGIFVLFNLPDMVAAEFLADGVRVGAGDGQAHLRFNYRGNSFSEEMLLAMAPTKSVQQALQEPRRTP